MSKRDFESEFDGPPFKMRKDDQDDGGAAGRSGRVRKKSAKVLEMEEFEQVEKNQNVTKKGKTPKTGGRLSMFSDDQELGGHEKPGVSAKKPKSPKAPILTNLQNHLETTPLSSKVGKAIVGKSELPAQLVKPTQQFVQVQSSGILSSGASGSVAFTHSDLLAATSKHDYDSDLNAGVDTGLQLQLQSVQHGSPVKSDDQKSVIKYLLSSPTSGTKPLVSTNALTKLGVLSTSAGDSSVTKPAKKSKSQDKSAVKSKPKEKKLKEDSLSPQSTVDTLGLEPSGAGLKMKIFGSSDPSTAQVTLQANQTVPAKPKKIKKSKQSVELDPDLLLDSTDIFDLSDDMDSPPMKKMTKKVSKKKEKLIRDAISAAQQMPNLAALVASQSHYLGQDLETQITPFSQKSQKKKTKNTPSTSMSDDPNESCGKSDLSFGDGEGDDGEESHLVIAETEKKKKKPGSKKKALSLKEKAGSSSPKGGDKVDKKLSKRAPTAYMLFCNTHRPTIVNENPGIEFAAISRKLGEMWQTLSNKQKLQWRRKAQRRRKKGSNLISTGKTGKEPGVATLTPTSSGQVQISSGLKLSTLIQKAQRSSPDATPQSPTKNFSIEPIDVAAHLKLLGESLSIIGMRLQEHKGMIAVQGSLSVLLDSLLCACGPLLCLTQQVPGMDGCSPLIHAQTLDSVAYVMPGL